VQKHFWKEHLRALQVFFCTFISQLVCTHKRAQIRGNIEEDALLAPKYIRIDALSNFGRN